METKTIEKKTEDLLKGLCEKLIDITVGEQDEQLVDPVRKIYVSSNGTIIRKADGKTEVICSENPSLYANRGIIEIKEDYSK